MILLRSILYAVWFYGSLAVVGLSGMPAAFVSRRAAMTTIRTWARAQVFGLRWICGIRTEYRGLDHLPQTGCILAIRHQSTYDTIAPFLFTRDPAFVLKRELLDAPVFGVFAKKGGMIPIDLDGGMKTMKAMLAAARREADAGREVLIFPEGTRQPIEAPLDLKPGVAGIYRALDAPCAPVALNTGLCWPSSGFLRRPGTVVFEVLPPIEPGLSRDAFMTRLAEALEPATQRLLEEGRANQDRQRTPVRS